MTGIKRTDYFNWSPDKIQELTDHWDQGYPASVIAIKMGGGLSRNAIVGKANRLGLKARKIKAPPRAVSILSKKRKNPFVRPPAAWPVPSVKESSSIQAPSGNLVPLMRMNYRTCRSVEDWEMVGGSRLALYCSNPKEAGASFCQYHQLIYYRKDYR